LDEDSRVAFWSQLSEDTWNCSINWDSQLIPAFSRFLQFGYLTSFHFGQLSPQQTAHCCSIW
jgi:hypothetical protein